MDVMGFYQEAAFERLYRWVQKVSASRAHPVMVVFWLSHSVC
jgi:hypothetical protein